MYESLIDDGCVIIEHCEYKGLVPERRPNNFLFL